MPGARGAVGIAVVVHTARASVDPPKWILGAPKQSCTDVCESVGRHCIGGYWPTDTRKLLNVSILAGGGVSDCVDAEYSDRKYAPAILGASCFYQPNQLVIECSLEPLEAEKRFCPCGTKAPQFMLAGVNMSCTEHCQSHGGVCSSDPGLWPINKTGVEQLAKPLGMACQFFNDQRDAVRSEPFHAPSINGDHCFFPQANNLVSCDASQSMVRRFCPCLGASMYATASHSHSGNSGSGMRGDRGTWPSSRSSDGVGQGGCRNGGFMKGEGTGGSKKLVPGGTRATSNGECRERVVQYCPDATGATFNHDSSDCWCEVGMTGYVATEGNSVCWFTDGTITTGGGSLIRRFIAGDVIFAGASSSTICACLVVAALASIAVVRLVQRRGAWQSDQALGGDASGALVRFEEAE